MPLATSTTVMKQVYFGTCCRKKSPGFIREKRSGRKQPKTRMILLVGNNMDGSDMMPLLAIGKIAKPRDFKGERKLPVQYLSNRKAWMRSDIFEAEMQKFDRRMKNEGRKVCMIVDNCSAHPVSNWRTLN